MIQVAIVVGLLVFMIACLSLSYLVILAMYTADRKGRNDDAQRVEMDD